MGFELYERRGHSKKKVAEGETLAEIAKISAEKEGMDPDRLFRLGVFDDE